MKREVKISDVGLEGITLDVVYRGVKCSVWPNIKTEHSSLAPGAPIAFGRDYFMRIISPRFQEASEASIWLDRLTEEVLELSLTSQARLESFRSLESTIELATD